MPPRSYTPHHIDAVSRSHIVAITGRTKPCMRFSNPGRAQHRCCNIVEEQISLRVFATPKWWRTWAFGELCLCVCVRLWSPRVIMHISREASARWSVDGSLNDNYSYSRTFTAVTSRFWTWWARPEPMMHAQQEFAILRTSVFDTDFVALLRQSFRRS